MSEETQIAQPTSKFTIEMLNPESWQINHHVGRMCGSVISTDEWMRMQELALSYLGDHHSKIVPTESIDLWKSIISGEVPTGLRITKPDPMTNIR